MVNVGILIGKVFVGIFLLFGAGLLGFLGLVFFKHLKKFVGFETQTPKTNESKKQKEVGGSYCGKCGLGLGEKDLFCRKCGGKK